MNEDVQLIDECLRGDSGSFGLLVRKYQDRLFNTLVPRGRFSRRGRRRDARGVCASVRQAGVLSAQQRVLHLALPHCFQHGRQPQPPQRPQCSVDAARDVLGEEPMDTTEEVTERLLREERATQVRAALEELTEEHRAILVLREMEGLCYEEIADVLELPVGTVRSRLHRARSQMRDQLKEVLGEYQP